MGSDKNWIDTKQMQQTMNVQQAYAEVQELPLTEFTEIKMDGIDKAYVWARTFTPSWVMGLIFITGVIVLIPFVLKKFGVNIAITRGK